jgi:hypothetical protein
MFIIFDFLVFFLYENFRDFKSSIVLTVRTCACIFKINK